MLLLNPGDFSRPCLVQMGLAAEKLGIGVDTLELAQVWDLRRRGQSTSAGELAELLKKRNVRAVLGYTYHGAWEWPSIKQYDGTSKTFFANEGVHHLMWWTDHPHWANEQTALQPEIRSLLASPFHHHFVKSPSAALDLAEVF